MELKPKILLVSSIVCIVAGLVIGSGVVDVDGVPGLYVLLPLGVILAGLFLVVRFFEGESRVQVNDQQQALKKAGIEVPRNQTPAKRGSIISK